MGIHLRLYIAEKPGLGRAIADVLPKPHRREEGCIRVGNGDYVSWCIGHLLEQAEPKDYDPAYQKWCEEHLPIIPKDWKLNPRSKTRKQLAVLRKLVKQSDEIIHAGDPDREGQLLVDQVIDYLGVKGKKLDAVKRCLISDLNPAAVELALTKLRSNKDFSPLSTSALARSRADWLYGINMTRAYTLRGRKVGFDGLLSVGRVQTPVLGLVTRRDQEIENFVSRPFYEVLAHLELVEKKTADETAHCFVAKWHPSTACEAYMDEDGRVLSKKLAKNVVERIFDKPARVKDMVVKAKIQAPPLPYNLSTLQIDAANRFSMSAQQVLDHCQSLYERHKLITYPRSDNRYLPEEHFSHGANVVKAVGRNSESLSNHAELADTRLKSKAWNDKKVSAHHAIIPTEKSSKAEVISRQLSRQELQIYELIARQFLCQFYPRHEYTDTRLELEIEGGLFVASVRESKVEGWKQLFPAVSRKRNKSGDEAPSRLPALKKDELLHCLRGELLEKQTQPPMHFTDATLLAAMTGIARFVKDLQVRKILKETDGLGTEATRAGIIELLFKRKFLIRKGKQIRSTQTGKALIQSLPESATLPDMTAQWEFVLDAISKKQANYSAFMQPLIDSLHALISQSKSILPLELKGLKSGKGNFKKSRRRKSKKASK